MIRVHLVHSDEVWNVFQYQTQWKIFAFGFINFPSAIWATKQGARFTVGHRNCTETSTWRIHYWCKFRGFWFACKQLANKRVSFSINLSHQYGWAVELSLRFTIELVTSTLSVMNGNPFCQSCQPRRALSRIERRHNSSVATQDS